MHQLRRGELRSVEKSGERAPGSWIAQGALLIGALLALAYSYHRYARSTFEKSLAPPVERFAFTPPLALPEVELSREHRISRTVSAADSFVSLLQGYGISPNVVQDSLSQTLQLLPGARLILSLDGSGALTKAGVEGGKVEAVKEGEAFRFVEQIKSAAPAEHIAMGSISTSFDAAAKKSGIPQEIVDDLIDLFSDRIEFERDFRRGDRFTVIFRGAKGKRGAEVLAAAFQVKGTQVVASRYVGTDGKARYFNEKGEAFGNSFLRYPVQFSKITSTFQDARLHPILKIRRPHQGVDFAAPVGTPVRAVASGKVEFAGMKGAGGITIQIKHNDRYQTAYLHLSRIASGVRRGATVAKGQIIGAVGSTGLSTGPHLHYGFYDRGKYVDPLKIKLPVDEELGKGKKIDRRYLDKVLLTLQHYQGLKLEGVS